jgi:spore coat polysaccharide biosynthesis protein SpsF
VSSILHTVAIVQAHLGSTRLPGKVLLPIGGQTMLERVYHRVRQCHEIDDVVVATSTLPSDDRLVEFCQQRGMPAFRGSDSDVLQRYVDAARWCGADVCVRITSDCPLIDPTVADHIVRQFQSCSPLPDYASNKIAPSYPRGLDTEVFRTAALLRVAQEARLPYHRVHVTPYFYEHPERFALLNVAHPHDLSAKRWTVDTPEDLAFVRAVFERLGNGNEFSWQDVLRVLDHDPELEQLNGHIRQKAVTEG